MTIPLMTAQTLGQWRGALVPFLAYVVPSVAAAQALVVNYAGTGTIPALIVAGRTFILDAADTTSAHDGVTVIVTSDARRYKFADFPPIVAVQARQSTPPTVTSADFGKAWLVGASPTGIWASFAEHTAIYTARGWLYRPPGVGQTMHDVARAGSWTYTNAAAWVFGASAVGLVAGSVTVPALEMPAGLVVIEQRNTPPGTITGVYLIGSAPTGAWASHAGKIARGDGVSWTLLTPAEGWSLWNAATRTELRFTTGAWRDAAATAPLQAYRLQQDDAARVATGAYTFDLATAPTTSNTTAEALAITHTAQRVGNILRITYRAYAAAAFIVALFVDADAAAGAARWVDTPAGGFVEFTFHITATDTSAHTYTPRLAGGATLRRRSLTIEELTAS